MDDIWEQQCIISPSLICLDMMHIEDQVRRLENVGIKMLHIDILDGHFSPSMPLGFEVVKQLRNITDLKFECHVMTMSPEYFVEELLGAGADQITFHVETASHPDGLINTIKAEGVRAGLALKPSTPISVLEYEIEKCDAVLLMQINPGYASSKSEEKVSFADRKIRDLRRMITERNLNTKVILDGRVSLESIRDYGDGLVDIFVGGTTCISSTDVENSVKQVQKIREEIIKEC